MNEFVNAQGNVVDSAVPVIAPTPVVPAAWNPDHAYALNDQITDPAGLVQKVTTAGKSGLTQPKFNTLGETTTEGPNTLVWTAQKETEKPSLVGKTIVSLNTHQLGSTQVLDFLCTDNVHYFIKSSHNQIEIGGTEVWGTGALQS